MVAHSLATALVAAGMPAVIGWDGSVDDRAATMFAQRLYRGLADRADLAVAVGDARRVLLESGDPAVRADWHLARLWLGPAGGGSLVAGTRRAVAGARHCAAPRSSWRASRRCRWRRRRCSWAAAPNCRPRCGRCGPVSGPGCCCTGRAGWASRAWPPGSRTGARTTRWRWCSVTTGPWPSWTRSPTAVRTNPAARELIESRLAEVRRAARGDRGGAGGSAGRAVRPGRRRAGSGRCC